MFVHANLNPTKAKVCESVLYNMDPKKNRYVPCQIIGVSSYPGHAPTFQIVVENSSLFSYIPPHFLQLRSGNVDRLWGLDDLVYHNCPSAEFALSELEYLRDKELQVFLKKSKVWTQGKYFFTLDWYAGNDLLHCLILESGQPAFLPQHKLLLDKQEFKPYQKLRQEWRV